MEELDWAQMASRCHIRGSPKRISTPAWTHQKVSERNPASVNAKLKVEPLDPLREPENPESEENASE